MADDNLSGLDAVDAGPIASDGDDGAGYKRTGDPTEHATVSAPSFRAQR